MNPSEIIDKILPAISEKDYHLLDLQSILAASSVSSRDFFSTFSDLEDFIIKAFSHLCDKADELAVKMDQPTFSLNTLFNIMEGILKLQLKYRFFFLNLLSVIKNHEQCKDRYLELTALRKTQLVHLFNLLVAEEVFDKEKFPGNFENLSNQIMMLSEYWLTHNYVVFGPDDLRFTYYSRLIFSTVLPYLSEKGMLYYKSILGYGRLGKSA